MKKMLPLVRLVTHPKLLLSRETIFLFSHMRANTSVLGHILGSHPEIEGYYEMHKDYPTRESLWRHKLAYLRDQRPKATSHIFFDKLLHDYTVAPEILESPRTKAIFMLRKPERSIKSIVELFSKKRTGHEYATPEHAARYYADRLNRLAEISKSLPNTVYYLDAESLTEDPLATLASLGTWLALKTPLKAEYTLFSKTGKEKAGDSSECIKLGKLAPQKHGYDHIDIPAALLRDADRIYNECRSKILESSHAYG